MRILGLVTAALLGLSLAAATPAFGEDDIVAAAKKERERRAALKKKKEAAQKGQNGDAKPPVLSNSDLKKGGGGNVSTVGDKSAPGAATASKPKPKTAAGDASDQGQEAYWQDRRAQLEKNLEEAKKELEAHNQKINDLRRMSAAADDPVVRHQTSQALIAAEGDVTNKQKAVSDAQTAFDDLREEARQAGVPPGWLR